MNKFGINRFFFTITPPQPVQDFISDLKKHVHTALGHEFQDEFSPVHIALFKYSDKTDYSLYDTDWLAAALLPFEIRVKGLGIFKHGVNRTIHLQIEYKSPVPLATLLGEEPITPHIIIARNLDSDDFAKAWESLQSISYNNYFHCNTVAVLKRKPNQWNRYLELPIDRFADSPLPQLIESKNNRF